MEWNDAAFDEFTRSKQVVAATRALAETVEAIGKSIAPDRSGDYRASIHVERAERKGRVVYLVKSDDPGAMAIEARFGTLGKAARSV